jgi:hypothetical protein
MFELTRRVTLICVSRLSAATLMVAMVFGGGHAVAFAQCSGTPTGVECDASPWRSPGTTGIPDSPGYVSMDGIWATLQLPSGVTSGKTTLRWSVTQIPDLIRQAGFIKNPQLFLRMLFQDNGGGHVNVYLKEMSWYGGPIKTILQVSSDWFPSSPYPQTGSNGSACGVFGWNWDPDRKNWFFDFDHNLYWIEVTLSGTSTNPPSIGGVEVGIRDCAGAGVTY